jgi:NitT/TauT family transport system substrate-binding protein
VLEFQSGQIAGASEPSPYDVQIVKAGGKVLYTETGVTTVLMVTQSFLSAHPDIVADLLKAQIQANDFIKSSPAQAEQVANDQLAAYTGKPIKADILDQAFKEITFTNDPDVASLNDDASQAVSVGLLKPVKLDGIFDLGPLNALLAAAGEAQVGA